MTITCLVPCHLLVVQAMHQNVESHQAEFLRGWLFEQCGHGERSYPDNKRSYCSVQEGGLYLGEVDQQQSHHFADHHRGSKGQGPKGVGSGLRWAEEQKAGNNKRHQCEWCVFSYRLSHRLFFWLEEADDSSSWYLRLKTMWLEQSDCRRQLDASVVNQETSQGRKQCVALRNHILTLLETAVAIIHYCQAQKYSEEISALSSGRTALSRHSPIYRLDPIFNDGLLRVGSWAAEQCQRKLSIHSFSPKTSILLHSFFSMFIRI